MSKIKQVNMRQVNKNILSTCLDKASERVKVRFLYLELIVFERPHSLKPKNLAHHGMKYAYEY
jgi:hypothetical protein